MDPIIGLGFGSLVPPNIKKTDMVAMRKINARTACLEGAEDESRFFRTITAKGFEASHGLYSRNKEVRKRREKKKSRR